MSLKYNVNKFQVYGYSVANLSPAQTRSLTYIIFYYSWKRQKHTAQRKEETREKET